LEIELSVPQPLPLVTQIQKIGSGYVVSMMMDPIGKCGLLEIFVKRFAKV